jgi:hypothetical protein
MTQQYPAENIPGALARLIEAWHNRGEAERQLEEYERTNPQPAIPREPLSVDSLQDYHRRRMKFEAEHEEAKGKVKAPREHYEELQREVRLFLPQRRRVYYDYQGEQENLAGRYVILDIGRQLRIEPFTDARRTQWGGGVRG